MQRPAHGKVLWSLLAMVLDLAAGLLVWGGWLVGPALAVLAAVLPSWRRETQGAAVESTA